MRTGKAILATIVLGSALLAFGAAPASAQKKKKDNTAVTQNKKGDREQGTFAYRFDTYTQYAGGGESTCNDPNCGASMNADMRTNASPFAVRKQHPHKKTTKIKTDDTVTPAED